MKKAFFNTILLIILLLVWLSGPAQSGQTTVALSGTGAGCTPTLGSELLTAAICTAPTGITEGDATTGWTNQGSDPFDTAGTPCTSGCGVDTGNSYALRATANSAWDGASYLLTVTEETLYVVSLWARHNGTGNNWDVILSSAWGTGVGPKQTYTSADTTYTQFKKLFYAHDYLKTFLLSSNSAGTGGLYVDALSLKTVTPCLGSELHTTANAASLSPNEANATTGWTAVNSLNSLTSDATYYADGSYSILADATTNPIASNGVSFDLSTLSLVTNTHYLVSWKGRHLGSGDYWYCGFSSAATTAPTNTIRLGAGDTTFKQKGWEITYSSSVRYFNCIETGSNNNGGVYIDAFSVKEIVSD
jgi:hypothetical protein